MTDVLSDELLQRIAQSSGRCYAHEGRAMAAELLALRALRRAEQAAAAQTPAPWPPAPFP